MKQQVLDLRDIHLPEPVSWWPLAPGWWMLLGCILLAIITLLFARKFYLSRQLKRDITAELERIKQQFTKTQNKMQLAKALSILLRRANITYNPAADVAGLTGDDWLNWLDHDLKDGSDTTRFNSDTGKILLEAPYLPDDAAADFDATQLIQLCESWLLRSHHKRAKSS